MFDTWMIEELGNVRALAMAYDENLALKAFASAIQSTKPTLRLTLNVFSLYALGRVIIDGVFFIKNGLVNAQQMAQDEITRLCSMLCKKSVRRLVASAYNCGKRV